jgi:excisionase family DNA binding protein
VCACAIFGHLIPGTQAEMQIILWTAQQTQVVIDHASHCRASACSRSLTLGMLVHVKSAANGCWSVASDQLAHYNWEANWYPCEGKRAKTMISQSDSNRAKPRWYKVKEVAARLHVDERSVRRWIKSGTLRCHRFGRAVRISEDDLITFESLARR